MKDYISICCRNCGREIALIACKEFEVVSCTHDYNYSEAVGEYWIGGYCRKCAVDLNAEDR